MEISDSEATFLAEALGELPDKEKAIGFLNTFVRSSSALVREGALLGLSHIMKSEQEARNSQKNYYAAAKDLIRIVMLYDTDMVIRRVAEEILSD